MRRLDWNPTRASMPLWLCSLVAATAIPGRAHAAVAYVRSDAGSPWGSTSNEEAMDLVFGPGAWDDLRYETVDPAALLSGAYAFIYMEGSDSNAMELEMFLMINQAALEGWVADGGGLLLNAAPNEGAMQNWGFGGVVLDYVNMATNPGTAVDATHPIWIGPFAPTPLMFTGGSYAHASISGPGLIPHIQDADGDVNLAELSMFGTGGVIFGGLTTSNFWDPPVESLNLRANVISYLSSEDSDGDAIADAFDNCPDVVNPAQEDADEDNVGDACDSCPDDPLNDADEDGACDTSDNCRELANPMQADDDADGRGNACDPCPGDPDDDADNDTLCGDVDNCPMDININQADSDRDGIGNLCDVCPYDAGNDEDDDGVCLGEDNCPEVANSDQADADGNGVGDACDDAGSSGGSGGTLDTGDGMTGGVDTSAGEGTGGGNPGGSGSGTGDGSANDGGGEASGCRVSGRSGLTSTGRLLLLAAVAGLRRRRATLR